MNELIQSYINKRCIIYNCDAMSSQTVGEIKEINNGWIKVDTGKREELFNVEYITRIVDYPKKKKKI